jgi:phospholipid/cholesterol/gamma-HCH transport system substrate-binding protein
VASITTTVGSALRFQDLRDSLNLEVLNRSRAARAIMGLLLSALVGGVVVVIFMAFTGHFTSAVDVNAQLSGQGNAVEVGSPVEYRDVTVGKVLTESQAAGGRIALVLEMYKDKLAAVPTGVTASVSPLSIFGNQFVDLHAPAQIGAGHIAAGDFIPADLSAPSDSLQGSVTALYNLLSAIHPADLDTALTAFATALRGEGKNLGRSFVAQQNYLSGIVPNLGTLNSDIELLAPVNEDLAAAAPNLVGILGNSAIAAPTITDYAQQLHQFITGGAAVAGQSTTLSQGLYNSYPTLANEDTPILQDISRNPNELSQTLTGLGNWAAAWAAAEHGPFITLAGKLPVTNINAAVEASLGYNATANVALGLAPFVNPATYTAADCPQYPGESNPYCGGGSPANSQPGIGSAPASSSSSGAPSPGATTSASAGPAAGAPSYPADPAASGAPQAQSSPSPAEQQAMMQMAQGLDGGAHPSPGLTDVWLYSLLASVTPGS